MNAPARRQRIQLVRLLALLVVVTVAGVACGGGDDDAGDDAGGATGTRADEEETPKAGGSITVGLEAESGGWQPCFDTWSEAGTMVGQTIYDPLAQRSEDGEIEPYLAQSFTPNADATEWTLMLRSGVKFHDGTDLTAQVLKENYDAFRAPASRCAGALQVVKDVQVADPMTLKFTMTGPYSPFPELLLTAYPYSTANAAARGHDVSANPVGTGPFKFVSWQRDNQLIVEKNPDYWQKGLPYLDKITFRPIPDEDARLASLTSGQVDVMHTLRQQYVKQARNLGDDVERYEYVGNQCGAAIFNVTKPPVDDKRVRRAIAYSLNQEELIAVLGGEGISPICTQFYAKDSPWYSKEVARSYPQNDVAKGTKELDAYKNDPKRSDGKPVGSDVNVDFNCPPDPSLIAVAQAFQQHTQKVGVKMKLNQVEQAAHINNAVGKAPFTTADYMINCWRLGAQNDPDTVLFNPYGKVEGNSQNLTNFDNAQVQALLQQGRVETDHAKRKAIYEQIFEIFNEEVPHVWAGATVTSVVATPNVKGILSWKLPSGDRGNGAELSVVRFRGVWLDS